MASPPWQSRMPDKKADTVFESMNASIGVDRRLFREEIAGTRAHAAALNQAGVYAQDEYEKVCAALGQIENEIAGGTWSLDRYEDVHTAVESRLTDLTGAAGAKIQTGRSRNEQTVLSQRLFLKSALAELAKRIVELQTVVIEQADLNIDVLLPGYTHARPAQPIRFAHYLLALFFGLERDKGRLLDARKRIDACPSGVGALAGTTFGLDREALAQALGFSAPTENSLDTVTDRDGQIEVLSALSILQVRISRVAEDLILWSSPQFGFLDLDEAYCTSSSLMPQKKNPDALELLRGKTGRIVGSLISLLVVCKGLPTGYQKDLQEDKEPLFDAVDTSLTSLAVSRGIMSGLRLDPDRMKAAITPDCMATDLADRLVEKGVPFREAYRITAERFAGTRQDAASHEAEETPTPESSVERRNATGGTGRQSVKAQIQKARGILCSGQAT